MNKDMIHIIISHIIMNTSNKEKNLFLTTRNDNRNHSF